MSAEHQNTPSSMFSGMAVLIGGVATTAVTLIAMWILAGVNENLDIMSYYIAVIIPIGAIIVGIGAGSGYGITAWILGRKIGMGLVVLVLVFQVGAYFAAQYIPFKAMGPVAITYEQVSEVDAEGTPESANGDEPALNPQEGRPLTFLEYYDLITRNMTFSSRGSESSEPLGALGYGIRLLEIAGFALGGLIIPLVIGSKSYCDKCRVYMRTKSLCLIPASIPERKVNKKDAEAMAAYQEDMQEAHQAGLELAQGLLDAAKQNDAAAIRQTVDAYAGTRKQTNKLPHRLEIQIVSCPRCSDGFVLCKLHSGQGDKSESKELARQPVSSDVTRRLLTGV